MCHNPLICCEEYARTFCKIISVTITTLLIYLCPEGGIPNARRQKCLKSVGKCYDRKRALSAVVLIVALIHTLKALFVAADVLNYLEMEKHIYTRNTILCSSQTTLHE